MVHPPELVGEVQAVKHESPEAAAWVRETILQRVRRFPRRRGGLQKKKHKGPAELDEGGGERRRDGRFDGLCVGVRVGSTRKSFALVIIKPTTSPVPKTNWN